MQRNIKSLVVLLSVWWKFQYLWPRWSGWKRAGWRSCPRSWLRTQTKTSQVGSLERLSGVINPSAQSVPKRIITQPQALHICALILRWECELLTFTFSTRLDIIRHVFVILHVSVVDFVVLQHVFPLLICHTPAVFYVKRNSSGGSTGLLWRLGRTQFSCPSRALRDQWTKHLRTALKTHSKNGEVEKPQTTLMSHESLSQFNMSVIIFKSSLISKFAVFFEL